MKTLYQTMAALAFGFAVSCSAPESAPKEVEYFPAPTSTTVVNSEKQALIIDTVVKDLENPWGMAFLPNGDVLITERRGVIRVVRGGKLLPDTLLGVPKVVAMGQGGLLDIKLHPDFANNGWIYFSYSAPGEVDTVANTAVMRAKLEGMQLVNQEKVFQAQPFFSTKHHFGSRIVFDKAPEGGYYMYVSVGDRGTKENAQGLDTHSGKVMRLYDDGRVPTDNPFVDSANAMKEIFSYGNRNPQGMALNPMTGELWAHEHGPKGGDEVNIIRAGNNYGWPAISYGINYDGTIMTEDSVMEGMEQPLLFWRPSIAPCGMTFYTADRYPGWKNNLFVGSLSFRYLNRCELQGDLIVQQEKLLDGMGRVRAVEQAPDGYLYVATESPGMVIRLFPAPATTAMK